METPEAAKKLDRLVVNRGLELLAIGWRVSDDQHGHLEEIHNFPGERLHD